MIIEIAALGISVVSVSIAAHTKFKQRQKRRLKELGQELKDLEKGLRLISSELRKPRSHEDTDLQLENIAKEVLRVQHELGIEQVDISVKGKTGVSDDETIEEAEELASKLQSDDLVLFDVRVGSLDELYTSDRWYSLHDPVGYSAHILSQIEKIDDDFGDVIKEFDESIFDEIKSEVDEIVEQTANHAISEARSFSITPEDFTSVDKMGNFVFRRAYHYEGIEGDLSRLDECRESIEDLRTTVLQASYS